MSKLNKRHEKLLSWIMRIYKCTNFTELLIIIYKYALVSLNMLLVEVIK